MTRDEFFTAVLLKCGDPYEEWRAAPPLNHYEHVLAAMNELAPQSPPETLRYADFLAWCAEGRGHG